MLLLKPLHWNDYELIDSGGYKKLEKFGEFFLARPEPQAVWRPSLSEQEWDSKVNATFKRASNGKEKLDGEKGEWLLKKGMAQQWYINYPLNDTKISFRLGLTAFKHVGIFPEQASNWDYIYKRIKEMPVEKPKVLNLFAYTGGASLAAKAAGADVVHVDSVKQVINWSRENMEASQLNDIRWVVEDAMKFVQREARRGNKYHGIILDPPAYGRGPKGEKWVIQEQIHEMISACKELLSPTHHFFILNLYSIGFSALVQETLVQSVFGTVSHPEMGELYLEDSFNKKLPLGTFYRFYK
ncbi:class I SAM-dependent methyltransferase [Cytophagaceae bacterium ABcell3]|nr:class I SAM-dependent methyltransferase [Cytophagaceae bacterium ABcell3]